jgi:hypothetical protein
MAKVQLRAAVTSIHRCVERANLFGSYLYNDAKGEKHAPFQNPVSELE